MRLIPTKQKMTMRFWIFLAVLTPLLTSSCDNSLSREEQLERDEALILEYLETNSLTAQKDDSGLYYDIASPGTGDIPDRQQFVEIRYKGYYLDNTLFDEIDEDEDPLIVPLQNLPIGLVTGIQLLRPGGSGTFYLPAVLGNGADVLVFDVDLIEVFDTRAQVDDKKIRNYLARKELEATMDETGVYYILDNPGNNETPNLRDTLTVRYRGFLLNDVVFDETEGQSTANFTLENLIEGWQIAVPLIEEGGKGTIFIPSELGYGDVPQGNIIPPNSVLGFDVEIVEIRREQ